MDRRLQINVKVIGDTSLAPPYIALGRRIVQQALSRNKTTLHVRTGVNGKWKLEVLLNKLVAFITVEVAEKLRFFTVNVHREFENYFIGSPEDLSRHTDTPTRIGCSGVNGVEIYRMEMPENTVDPGSDLSVFSFYPPSLAIEENGWMNFRPMEDRRAYYLEAEDDTVEVYGLVQRALKLSQTPRPPKKTSGENEKLTEIFPAPAGSGDYGHFLDFVLNRHSYLDTDQQPRDTLLLSVRAGAYNGETPPDNQVQYFPVWYWSHDAGASWIAIPLTLDGFTPNVYPPAGPIQKEYFQTGLRPVSTAYYRDYQFRHVYRQTVPADATSLSRISDIERIFITGAYFDGSGTLNVDDEGNSADLMAFFTQQRTIAGTSSAAAKRDMAASIVSAGVTASYRYNLGDGRMMLVLVAQDLVNSLMNVVTPEDEEEDPDPDSIDSAQLRYACYSFVSNDYGETFETRQVWGDNGYPSKCAFTCKDSPTPDVCMADCNEATTGRYGGPLAGIFDRHRDALKMNAGCATVLARGCMWRAQFDPNPPYDASFWFSNDGGESWTETARPREGEINHLMVSLPVLLKEAPSVPLTEENEDTRGKTASIAMNVYTPAPENPGIGDWAIYYTRDSGATWKKGYVWESGLPPPEPRDAARYRSLSCMQAKLLNGVLDPQPPP